MAHVNLLPWREEARQRAKQSFGIQVAVAILIAGAIFGAAYFVIGDYQKTQRMRNQFLQSQIQILDAQIAEIQTINKKKDEITNRMKLIQQLHQDRNTAIRIFNELARRTPDGVHLTQVEKKDDLLIITGRSVSNNRVSEFLRAIAQSPIFADATMREVVADKSSTATANTPQKYSLFSLTVTIVNTGSSESKP